jgi:hypothetical protein
MVPPRAALPQPIKWDTHMKASRIALFAFAAVVGLGALTGSAQVSPASAGQWDWLGNKPYVDCLKVANMFSGWDGGYRTYTGAEKEARYDRGRRQCNMKHYGHQ